MLNGVSNARELLHEDNRALALVEGGSYIASGFIISACITLDDAWLSILFCTFLASPYFWCSLRQILGSFSLREIWQTFWGSWRCSCSR